MHDPLSIEFQDYIKLMDQIGAKFNPTSGLFQKDDLTFSIGMSDHGILVKSKGNPLGAFDICRGNLIGAYNVDGLRNLLEQLKLC